MYAGYLQWRMSAQQVHFAEAMGRAASDPSRDNQMEQPSSQSGVGPENRYAKLVSSLLPKPRKDGTLDFSVCGEDSVETNFPHAPFYTVMAANSAAKRELRLAGGRTPASDQRVLEKFYTFKLRFMVYALEVFFRDELLLDKRCRMYDLLGQPIPNRVLLFCPFKETNLGVEPCIKYTAVDGALRYVLGRDRSTGIIASIHRCHDPACCQNKPKMQEFQRKWWTVIDPTGEKHRPPAPGTWTPMDIYNFGKDRYCTIDGKSVNDEVILPPLPPPAGLHLRTLICSKRACDCVLALAARR